MTLRSQRAAPAIGRRDFIFAAVLPQLGKPEEDALRIVREIRDRSGLLVERRPGAARQLP